MSAPKSKGEMTGPLVCPNGHAMDDGLFHCPCCGAYRPSATDPDALIENGRVVGVKPAAQTFPWWWCEDCLEEFQETGVRVVRCPSCGSKNIERDEET